MRISDWSSDVCSSDLNVDVETLVAAILHDTIEDTPLDRAQLASEFGETVAELVDGATKLDKIKFQDRQEAAAASFSKLLLALARDLRVILIQLAARMQNLRTMRAQSQAVRERSDKRRAGSGRVRTSSSRGAPGLTKNK